MQITKEKFEEIVGDASTANQCSLGSTVIGTFFKIGDKIMFALSTDQCLIIKECKDQKEAATYCMN